jgi:acyl carrier protein
MNVKEEIINLLCEKLGFEPIEITEDKDIVNDLGADSLDMVEVVMGIEEKYGIKIDGREVDGIKTVGDLIERAEKLVKNM